jgi:acyl-CoA synthetase (AMP-forming)/AMP-acid ligase II
MHPGAIAQAVPDRAAVIMGATGAARSFAELDAASNRLANLLRARGLEHGDAIAIFAENHPRFLEVTWAAQRAGLYYTAINSHLTAEEAAYIAGDCGATAVVSTAQLADVATAAFAPSRLPGVTVRLLLGADREGWERYEPVVEQQPSTPVSDEAEGDFLLYSSGTTGRPKGIQRPLSLAPLGDGPPGAVPFLRVLGFGDGDRYLCPAPLYHAAPLAWSMGAHRLGGTVVVMERFDPAETLRLIELHAITHAQFVPTHFVRMLKLDESVRTRFDLSSLRSVVHAAAPCPVEVKQAMIDWWGPIVNEYYSATEGVGATFITADDWLAHPGSVGRTMLGTPHILDDEGNELPAGAAGTVWFSGGHDFEYHNDPDKTASAKNELGYGTVGDIGYLDDEGYLYLTDRKAFMIISGGVNIYPQEAENVLITHPKVLDVGVIGVPDPEMGQAVKAVVQPIRWEDAGPELEAELIDHCRERLATYKCPRTVDFLEQLPRLDTGKLYKKALEARYADRDGSR